MKTIMKRSMALLLTVLMLLSCVVTGTFAFAASAEEEPETDASTPEVSLYRQNGQFIAEGSLVKMNTLAKKYYPDANLVCKFNKDVELDAPIVFQSKRIAIFEGQGHTIYFSKKLLETKVNFISFFDHGGKNTFEITFKNLNFSGQPMDWDGTKENATYFGTTEQDAGAISVHHLAKLVFDNCRLENFYANARGACFHFAGVNKAEDQEEALANRGLWLKDTVITNNYSGNTGAGTATVIRTRYGNVGSQVHVSGNTYVDNNYNANGQPFANIFVSRGDLKVDANTYASSVLRVESDFTGAVAINSVTGIAPATKTFKVEGSDPVTVTVVGDVYFDGAYDPTDGGFVYAWRGAGNTNKDLIVPKDATGASEAHRIQATAGNVFYYLDSTKAWTNVAGDAAFKALQASAATETLTKEQRLEAAKKNILVLTGDSCKAYGGSHQYYGMYTVYGNGHTLTAGWDDTWGGMPMLRYGKNSTTPQVAAENTTIIFNDIILDGDIKVTVGDDGYLEFDKISTADVETNAIGAGSDNGGALEAGTAGQYIELNNVEIRNFTQNRCNWAVGSDKRFGSAIYTSVASEWHINDVSIHDNYTGESSSPLHFANTGARAYFSGDIELYNNYVTKYEKLGPANESATADKKAVVVDNFTIVKKADARIAEASIDGSIMRFEEDAKGDSFIMSSEGIYFANLATSATEIGVNFVNALNPTFKPYITETILDGYAVLRWMDPTNVPEEVTFKIYGRDNTTVVIDDLTRMIAGGDNLPPLTGLTWYNGETAVTTHSKGVTTYEGKWADDAVATILVSTDNRKTWTITSNLDAVTYSETLATDIELLQGYEFDKSRTIAKNAIFTLDGNGFTNTIKSGATFGNIFSSAANTEEVTTKTFKNFVLDGTGWTEIGSETGAIYTLSNSGNWVFDNCTFKNLVGAGQAGVFRPTGIVTMVLKDVLMENCGGTQGSIRTGYSNDDGPLLILAGNTTINDGTADGVNAGTNGAYNRIYFNTEGAIAITEDFTGDVDIWGNSLKTVGGKAWGDVDRVLASANYVDSATVAEGAKIAGKIWNLNQAGLFAYDNNGTLCWGDASVLSKVACTFDVKGGFAVIEDGKYDVGAELPMPKKADFTGAAPAFYKSEWYYDNAEGIATKTTVTVEGFTHYYVGEYVVDTEVEAYVDADNYGTLVEVVTNSDSNDVIEFNKDIYLAEKIVLSKDLTFDGNGYKLSFALDENGKAILRDFLIHVGNNRKVLFNNIVFDGLGTPGVWGQDIQKANTGFVSVGKVADAKGTIDLTLSQYGITYNDCTFRGLRLFTLSESHSAIGVNGYRTTFTGNTLITDNMFRSTQYKIVDGKYQFQKDADGNYIPATDDNCLNAEGKVASATNKIGAIIRGDASTLVYIKDNAQMYNNFGIYMTKPEGSDTYEDNFVHNSEFTSGGSDKKTGHHRVVIGPLAETANIYGTFATGYLVALDADGKAYNLGNMVKSRDGVESYNILVSAHNPKAADVAADLAFHTSTGGDVCVIGRTVPAGQLIIGSSSGMSIGGNLASDRFTLDFYLTMRANVADILTVSIGDVVISEMTVAEYGLPITRRLNANDSYGWYKVSVDVGMAQLTDTIKFVLTNADGEKLGSTYTTTAKAYIDTLIAKDDETLASTGADAAKLRVALVSLLQYGTMAQVQFNHNVEKLANDGDYSAYDITKVEEEAIFFGASEQLKATKTGALDGLTVLGSSLILNNQISLRIYVSTEDATAYTYTIDGEAYELQTGKNGSYIEIANIGTADLAEFVTLTISDGANEIVYKVSPMSYVYAVNQSASQPEALKNVCEAMFYYFDAVMAAYGIDHGIDFVTEVVMNIALDEANAYSIPYGIAG